MTTTLAGHANLGKKLASILTSYDLRSDTSHVQFALASPSRDWAWEWPPSRTGAQYFIASATKLYVATLIMQLRDEGDVDLDAEASRYLQPSVMDGIHVLRGVDSSHKITVRELLSHTSGIADYFEQRRANGRSTFRDAFASDFGWSFEDVLRITKEDMKPKFYPSTPGKAFYSDTNYQILGAIVEAVAGVTFEEAVKSRVINTLRVTRTYPFTTDTVGRYSEVAPMLYGKQPVAIPKAMASVRADGGLVSSANDGLAFLQAFMTGQLFPQAYIEDMQRKWNRIFPPLEYGTGIMRFALPRYFSPLRAAPPMVGHSGASGAVLFFVPTLDLYVSGTVNQIKKRSLSYNLMVRLVFACLDAWSTQRSR